MHHHMSSSHASIQHAALLALVLTYLLAYLLLFLLMLPCIVVWNASAVCACVDMEDRVPGAGSQWFCLHATCACTEEEAALAAAASAAASSKPFLAAAVSAALMTVMVY